MKVLGVATVRLLRAVLALGLGVVLLGLVAAAVLVWRLDQGPVEVTGAARWAARHWGVAASAGRVTAAVVRRPGEGLGGRALRVAVEDAAYPAVAGTLRHGVAELGLAALLSGRVEPREVALDGVRGRWMQEPGGGDGPALREVVATLRRVSVSDVAVEVVAPGGEGTLQVSAAGGEVLRDTQGGLSGYLAADASLGGVAVHVDVQGEGGASGSVLHLQSSAVSPAALAQVVPGALARVVPALAAVGALDAPVSLRVDAMLDGALRPVRAVVHAEAGPGTVQLPKKDGGTSAGRFSAASLDVEGTADAVTRAGLRLVLTPPSGHPPTVLAISGTGVREGERFTAHLAVELDRLAASDLGALWPAGVGGDSRDWLAQNITAGGVHDGHFTLTLVGTLAGDDLDVTQAGGGMTGEDLTVWWLRPVPPLEHVHAALTWLEPDVMLIAMGGGRTGAIAARTGSVRITGLAGNHQVALITADLAGPLGAVVTLLRHKRLKLLSEHPLPITGATGAVTDRLTVRLPLEADVEVDQVGIHSAGQIANGHVGGIAAGRDLDGAQLAIDVTNDGLALSGTAQVAHVPARLAVEMDFRDGGPAQVVQHVAATGRITERDAQAAGLAALGLRSGAMVVALDYAERKDGQAALQVNADLGGAAFQTPFGWAKAAGSAGQMRARALLANGKLVGLDGVRVDAPGLSVAAHGELAAGRPAVVHIDRAEVGRSSFAGTVALPQREGEPYRVSLSGRQLDLEGRWQGQDSAGPASKGAASQEQGGPSEPGIPYEVSLRFERVLLAANKGLGPVALTASGDGRRLVAARLSVGGAARLEASVTPAGGQRRVRVEASDLGLLLLEADLATELVGGEFSLAAEYDDRQADSPLEGTAELRRFKVRGAPVLGKVLQGVTVYGLADALRGPGLAMDRLAAPFRLAGSVLDVKDARATSSSLGFTATGRLDFGRKLVDLRGAIVPAYFFNALPGRIPLVGRLFRTGQGTGLFAANYALRGPLAAPSVSVNPFSALTPGFTRRLFDMFD